MGKQGCCVLPGPGPELELHHRGGSASQPQPKHFSRKGAETQSRSWIQILFLVFTPWRETSVQRIDELSFHHAFIGPNDLNAQLLELAIKRGPREMQDLSAFLYVAAGAFESLHDRFTLNLRHRHQWRNNKRRTNDSRTMKFFR